jgi:hypothetical protein
MAIFIVPKMCSYCYFIVLHRTHTLFHLARHHDLFVAAADASFLDGCFDRRLVKKGDAASP